MKQGTSKPTKVFVVHGRNTKIRDAMFTFLRSIGLEPIEWSQAVQLTKKASPYIGEILDAALAEAQAIVVVMTPDDEARLLPPFWTKGEPEYEKEFRAQPRPNVLFEAGLALGRARDRTVLIEVGTIKPFSDIGGMHTVRLDDRTQRRQDLANRLQAAGCAVNLSGTDWHTSGNFQINDAPTSTSAVGETETKAVQSSDIVKEKLSEVEENILKLLAGGEDVRKATVQLASSLKVGFDKVQHHVDNLRKKGYLEGIYYMSSTPPQYYLKPKGRAYLVEHNLL